MTGASPFKRALVTGATGYVGYHLAQRLARDEWEVGIVARPGSEAKKLEKLPLVSFYQHDGTTQGLIAIVKQARPEIIFHVASLVQISHDAKDLDPLIASNILFGTQLLEAAVRSEVQFFVNTGSYWQHYESQDYHPVNLYAATKQAFQDILRFYTEVFPLRAVTLKLFDVYGPEDPRDKLFNQLENACSTGKSLRMSAGGQLLDLVFIDDVVEAYCRAAFLLKFKTEGIEESYAVSSGRQIPLKEIADIYQKLTRRIIPIEWGGRPYRQREVMRPWTGKTLPGWKPAVDLETGISRMICQVSERK